MIAVDIRINHINRKRFIVYIKRNCYNLIGVNKKDRLNYIMNGYHVYRVLLEGLVVR
jgi:hypothetical protein